MFSSTVKFPPSMYSRKAKQAILTGDTSSCYVHGCTNRTPMVSNVYSEPISDMGMRKVDGEWRARCGFHRIYLGEALDLLNPNEVHKIVRKSYSMDYGDALQYMRDGLELVVNGYKSPEQVNPLLDYYNALKREARTYRWHRWTRFFRPSNYVFWLAKKQIPSDWIPVWIDEPYNLSR